MAAATSSMHIAMYPWFAFGHLTPFLQVSNKLAKKGHRVSFFIPSKTLPKLQPFNLFPHLITFVPITVPHVDGLPPGAETTADVSHTWQLSLIMTAMDRTQPEIECHLQDMKPDAIFFDFAHWVPKLARRLGIKSIYYSVTSAVSIGYIGTPSRKLCGLNLTQDDYMQPPPGYPTSIIKLHSREARHLVPWAAGSLAVMSFSSLAAVSLAVMSFSSLAAGSLAVMSFSSLAAGSLAVMSSNLYYFRHLFLVFLSEL